MKWLKRFIPRYFQVLLCEYFGKCNRFERELLLEHLKEAVFRTYFPKNQSKKKMFRQEIFSDVTNNLKMFHFYCFGSSGVKFKNSLDFSEDNIGNIIFIGFHTVSAYRRLLDLTKKYEIKRLAVLTQRRESLIDHLYRNYRMRLQKTKNCFEIDGVRVEILSLENSNALKRHSRLIQLLKKDTPLFLSYDIPISQENPLTDLFDNNGNPEKSSKYTIYSFKNRKLLMVSNYLLYLLQRTGSIGLPLYTRRLKDGRDLVIFGDPLFLNKDDNVKNQSEEMYDRLFDFMSNNILMSSDGWINANNLARIIPSLRKPEQEKKKREWQDAYIEANWKLSSPILIDRYKNETFLLTSISPIRSIKIGQATKKIIDDIRTHNKLTKDLKKELSKEKLKTSIVNLWNTGIIEKQI